MEYLSVSNQTIMLPITNVSKDKTSRCKWETITNPDRN